MNPEQGLAQQADPMRNIQQIAQMLIQGVSPEELIQGGIPQELVMAAMDMIAKQTTQLPQEQTGLAGMQLPQGM